MELTRVVGNAGKRTRIGRFASWVTDPGRDHDRSNDIPWLRSHPRWCRCRSSLWRRQRLRTSATVCVCAALLFSPGFAGVQYRWCRCSDAGCLLRFSGRLVLLRNAHGSNGELRDDIGGSDRRLRRATLPRHFHRRFERRHAGARNPPAVMSVWYDNHWCLDRYTPSTHSARVRANSVGCDHQLDRRNRARTHGVPDRRGRRHGARLRRGGQRDAALW